MKPEHLASLLDAARHSLRRDILPALDGDRRYVAAMVANALAVGSRALSLGSELEARQRTMLAALYDAPEAISLRQLERRLAFELRTARLTPDREEQVRAALLGRVLARLELSNPDYAATFPPSI